MCNIKKSALPVITEHIVTLISRASFGLAKRFFEGIVVFSFYLKKEAIMPPIISVIIINI